MKNSVPSIWSAQEKVLHFYRMLSLGLGLCALAMCAFAVSQYFKSPIVVVRSQGVQEFYPGERLRTAIDKEDVATFTKQFLVSLYAWREFNVDALTREISPFAENGLVEKVALAQTQKFKELKAKRLSQAITFVTVDVADDHVSARFDRVLKIENIPIVIPTVVTLSMIQGTPTRLNPMGIFVSGILESEGGK